LGAVLLTALPEMLRFTNEYRLILYGLIIVLVVLLRPDGLLTRTPTGRAIRILGYTLLPQRPVAMRAVDVGTRPLPSYLLTRQAAE
jgi:branched-chain amino acid transport system permease protein